MTPAKPARVKRSWSTGMTDAVTATTVIEAAAVQLDEAARQGQAQAGALLQMRAARLFEGFEDARLVGGRDAGTVVTHAHHHVVAGGTRADVDMPAPLGELHRVGEQIEE